MLFNLPNSTKTISASEVYESIKTGKNIVLLDVREDYEYKNGHIKGARLLPLGEIKTKIDTMNVPRETKLVVYCQSGARSAKACNILTHKGYNNVYNLGGIMNWPYETTQ